MNEFLPQEKENSIFWQKEINHLLRDWKRLPEDFVTREGFRSGRGADGKAMNKFRIAWFSAVIMVADMIIERGVITDSDVRQDIEKKVAELVSDLEIIRKDQAESDSPVKITEEMIDKGDAVLEIIERFIR